MGHHNSEILQFVNSLKPTKTATASLDAINARQRLIEENRNRAALLRRHGCTVSACETAAFAERMERTTPQVQLR